jgi:hypothetical protein
MSYPNQVLVEVHPGVNFTHITRYDQLGRGDQYMDDLAVGTARFNDCGGAGPVSHTITWDFETGAFPNPATTPTQVPAIVLLEGSPHFHYGRLTASPSDCGTSFFTTCPKTRAEVFFNQLNTTLGETRTYQIDLRMPSSGTGGSNTGTHRNMAWQLFGANGLSSRTIWIGINPANNHWYVANRVQPCNTNCVQNPLDDTPANVQLIDLGAVVYDQWETFKIIVKYATDTTGTVQALKNNTNMGTTSNQATISGVEPMQVYIDQLDFAGNFGIVDFDNLSMTDVQPSGPVKPPPPEGVTIQ